jgi:hypothetical protein
MKDWGLFPVRSMHILPSHKVNMTEHFTPGIMDSHFPGIRGSQRAADNLSTCNADAYKAWNITYAPIQCRTEKLSYL